MECRGVRWSTGESGYVLLLNRNWNETKHFQVSPDPLCGAADSRTTLATPNNPITPVKGVFIFIFYNRPSSQKSALRKKLFPHCETSSDELKDGCLKRGKIFKMIKVS